MKKTTRYLTLIVLLIISINSYAQWQKMFEKLTAIYEFAGNSNYVFCATAPAGIFRTPDNGLSWDTINTGLANKYVWTITAQSNYIFAGTDSGLYRSTNNGNNWSSIHNNIFNKYVYHLACDEQFIYAGTVIGMCRSSDHGNTWDSINNGLPKRPIGNTTVGISAITITSNYIYTGIQAVAIPKLYRSSNNGDNWIPIIYSGMDSISVYSLLAKDSILLCGTNKGVYISRNSGIAWRLIPEISINIGLFGFSIIDEQNLIVSHFGSGVYVSTDGGSNWFTKNEGLNIGEYYTCALYNVGNYTYLGTRPFDTYLPAIFRRSTQQLIPVIENSTIVPKDIELYQNYPNPFNATTKIKYSVKKKECVTLSIYDITGKKINTIVNSWKSIGEYDSIFKGAGLSSGIYFYILETDDTRITKSMILLK